MVVIIKTGIRMGGVTSVGGIPMDSMITAAGVRLRPGDQLGA